MLHNMCPALIGGITVGVVTAIGIGIFLWFNTIQKQRLNMLLLALLLLHPKSSIEFRQEVYRAIFSVKQRRGDLP